MPKATGTDQWHQGRVWCGGKWGVAVVCHDGIGRESERVELKGESFRKVLTLPRYWRSSTDWTGMLRNWWTDIGRNMHVGFCGSSHNTIIDCFGFFLIEIFSAWLRKGLKLFMTWMSQGRVIDIMTFNSYSLQNYSFWKGTQIIGI